MKNRFLAVVFALGLCVLAQPAYPGSTQTLSVYGRIGSIDGASSVRVRNEQGVRELKSGDLVGPGDTISTDGKTTLTVRCADGSVLVLGRDSELGVEDSPFAQRTARIDSGTVRAIVSKINVDKLQQKRKFRFFIKTKSATLGVRGTDFVVSADPAQERAELHTFEGTVEVAKNDETLATQGGVKVTGGEAIVATPKEITQPKVFDPQRFSEELQKTQPGLIPTVQRNVEASPSPSPSPSLSPSPSPEPSKEVDLESSRTSFKSMDIAFKQINGDFGTHPAGGEVAWTPMLQLISHWLALRGTVGFFAASSSGVFDKAFSGEDFKLMLSVRVLSHLLLEFGPTEEQWNGLGGLGGPSFTLGWEFTRRHFGALDRIFISYAGLDHPGFYDQRIQKLPQFQNCGMGPCGSNGGSHLEELRVGVGLRF